MLRRLLRRFQLFRGGNMTASLEARIVDMHTVFLGNGASWLRLSLPWLARDLAELIRCARTGHSAELADSQRVAAIRLALAKLEAGAATDDPPSSASAFCPKAHYRDAVIVEENDALPDVGPIVYLCRPKGMLDLEERLAFRDSRAATAVLVYSSQGAIAGPVLAARRYCPLCFRYMAAPVFGLEHDDEAAEEAMRHAGLALARTVSRQVGDTVVFTGKTLTIEPFVPFIGCPKCVG